MWRAGVRTGAAITISFPSRLGRMSMGEALIAYGIPKKWHQRMAAVSSLYCTLRSSAARAGVSAAGGTFMLSKCSSQNPARPAAAELDCAAALPATSVTASMKRRIMGLLLRRLHYRSPLFGVAGVAKFLERVGAGRGLV